MLGMLWGDMSRSERCCNVWDHHLKHRTWSGRSWRKSPPRFEPSLASWFIMVGMSIFRRCLHGWHPPTSVTSGCSSRVAGTWHGGYDRWVWWVNQWNLCDLIWDVNDDEFSRSWVWPASGTGLLHPVGPHTVTWPLRAHGHRFSPKSCWEVVQYCWLYRFSHFWLTIKPYNGGRKKNYAMEFPTERQEYFICTVTHCQGWSVFNPKPGS